MSGDEIQQSRLSERMTRKDQFLWVVQTGCLVRALRDNWDMSLPVRIMAAAVRIPEQALPEDVDQAAFEFLQWQFQYGSLDCEPPSWLASYVSSEVGDTGYWKF
jgi:hypothetical protein